MCHCRYFGNRVRCKLISVTTVRCHLRSHNSKSPDLSTVVAVGGVLGGCEFEATGRPILHEGGLEKLYAARYKLGVPPSGDRLRRPNEKCRR